MRIKRVECDQFAGVQGRELEFNNGLNIVVGDNESGKSTMVDLIYQILFKGVKLDGRSDSDFMDKYFPKKVSGPQGDVIDGVLVFETSNGTYKLKKEWEKGEGSCRLT
ncbi:MAG: AAA family ATPase, partial [Acetatifactor sp.]|nr:AAA family ATPase [Acetatifactor sp.]